MTPPNPVSAHPLLREGKAFAPSNIALIKYWGKRDSTLNLPLTSSLSVTLGPLGTTTRIRERDPQEHQDRIFLHQSPVDPSTSFYRKAVEFLNLSRPHPSITYEIYTESNIPIAAGLASSASGFAALTLALNDLYQWNLPSEELSRLARQGSGSACRSIQSGFVEWNKGEDPEGLDSFGTRLDLEWPELSIGILMLSTAQKPISSRDAMQRTRETSHLYKAWPTQVEHDLARLKPALLAKDLETVGAIAEHNALSMHATMLSAWPPVLYSTPKTIDCYHRLWAFREASQCPVYLTQDAGPNLKLITTRAHQAALDAIFPHMLWVHPFDQHAP